MLRARRIGTERADIGHAVARLEAGNTLADGLTTPAPSLPGVNGMDGAG